MQLKTSRIEFSAMVKLATPVVCAELGWVFMGIVDTMMVGRLGADAIGAVSLGSSLFLAVAVFGIGLLFGLDTFVSQAFGAGNLGECRRWLVDGIHLSFLITIPLSLIMLLPLTFLDSWGTDPSVAELTGPYLETLTLSIFPLFLYTSARRYLQAQSHVGIVMFTLVSANAVNALANWLLIFGNLGAPALGVTGAGWATLISRIYLGAVLFLYIAWLERSRLRSLSRDFPRFSRPRIQQLASLGFPAALQVTLEVGVFALATALASRLDAISLAAHQVALATASFTFMIPLGVSSAGAVRVGQALGRRSTDQAEEAGWTALLIGGGFMGLAAIVLLVAPSSILRLFTTNMELIAKGIPLLGVAAFFQIFDGLQVVATGILRGIGETRIPMITNLIFHWLVGLPVSFVFCFVFGWGVTGLWVGLCIGLTAVALRLVWVWARMILELKATGVPVPLPPAS